MDLYDKAELYLGNNENISAFAIFFRNSSKVVTSSGNYLDTEFFSRYYTSTHMTRISGVKKKLAAFCPAVLSRRRVFPQQPSFNQARQRSSAGCLQAVLEQQHHGAAVFWILMRSAPKRTSI